MATVWMASTSMPVTVMKDGKAITVTPMMAVAVIPAKMELLVNKGKIPLYAYALIGSMELSVKSVSIMCTWQ